MSEEKEIKISEVLALLESGIDRPAIKAKYGLSHAEMKSLFQHPKLKAKKVKKPLSFTIVDDVPEQLKRRSTDTTNRRKKVETTVVDDTNAQAAAPAASTVQETTTEQQAQPQQQPQQTNQAVPQTQAPAAEQAQEGNTTGTPTAGLW